MKTIKLFLTITLCLALVLCVGCAERSGDTLSREQSASVPSVGEVETSSAPSVIPLPGESSETGESGSISLTNPVEDLLACFDGLSDGEHEQARAFFTFIGDLLGKNVLSSVVQAIETEGYSDSLWYAKTGNSLHALRSMYLKEPETEWNVEFRSLGKAGSNPTTSVTFGGDICFADNYVGMQFLRTRQNGLADCIASEWFDIMQRADIATLNNEFAISDRGTPMNGKLWTFRGAVRNTAYYNALGVDLVSLANNHVYDYGRDAFLDTLGALDTFGISRAGAGRDAKEAQTPIYYIVNGRKIAFVSATRAEKLRLTPEATATDAGVFRCYDTTRLLEVLGETKQNCDYVILLIHWGTEGVHTLEDVQKETSHAYIDAGADLVIGAHAHRLQGIEIYNGKAIFYNLGNFWFDDYDIETGLAELKWHADGTEEWFFYPAMQSGCVTSYELGTALGRNILDHVESYSFDIEIDDNGKVRAK